MQYRAKKQYDPVRAEILFENALVRRSYDFAKKAHELVSHRRKYTGEPYIVHPIEVAVLVQSVPHTPEMLAAALLHDTVEDTATTAGDIELEFGLEVASLVAWLTDVSRADDGNRATRKAKDREHIARAPGQAKTVKLADLISNSRSIIEHDRGFARVYLREKAALMEVLREGDETLYALAQTILDEGLRTLSQPSRSR